MLHLRGRRGGAYVPEEVIMAQEAARHQYEVTSKWCGWWGRWGSEAAIIRHIEETTRATITGSEGWRLIETRSTMRFWWWIIPRPKILFIYSRPA